MNRPARGPCWVVFRRIEPGSSVDYGAANKLVKFYLRSPDRVDDFANYATRRSGDPRPGSIFSVEPFLRELDAIAAALVVGGNVQRVEEDENA